MHCICDIGYISIAGANFTKFSYVVTNNFHFDISRNIMFNTNSQVTVVRYNVLLYLHWAKLYIEVNNILIASVC